MAIKRYASIYLKLLNVNIKSKLEFAADFWISSIGLILTNLTSLFTLYFIFQHIPMLGGVSYYDTIFIFSFFTISTSLHQIFFDNIWSIWIHFIEGSFIKYCLRPIDSMFYYLTESIDPKGFSQLILGIALMAYSGANLNLNWSFINIIFLVVLLLCATSIYTSLMTIAAALGFWITDPFEVISLVNRSKDFGKYPITIFNNATKFIITFVLPLGFVGFYPSTFFVKDTINFMSLMTVPVALILFFAQRLIWKAGLNRYIPAGS
ncbi:MAG: ABC-2 family transporter protein [Lachnospiraceae bacterium]|nr:ABC-2 family transporter protein [Lachnospiraceae bacterium]